MLVFEIISYSICLTVLLVTFAHRSPLVYAAIFLFLLAPLRLPQDHKFEGVLIILAWSVALIVVSFLLKGRRISIDSFELYHPQKLNMVPFIMVMVIALVTGYFWMIAIGLEQFGGHHRRERTDFAGMARVIFRALLFYSYIVLALWRRSMSKAHLALALSIFLISVLGGYVSNRRGDVLMPILLIMIVRYFQIKSPTRKLKFSLFSAAVFLTAFVVVLEMTAQRNLSAYQTSWTDGISSLQSTIAGERGNGFSPNMEYEVISYVDENGAFLEAWTLLSGFWGLVPRVIWENKPDVSIGPEVGALVFGTGGGVIGLGAGTPVSIAAQVTAIFGAYSYLFGVLFVAHLYYVLFRLSQKVPIVFISILSASPWLMGADIGRMQINLTMQIIIVALVFKILALQVVYRKEISRKRRYVHKRF